MTDSLLFHQSLRKWVDTFSHRSMHASARFVKSRGFSMPQFFLLMHVYQHEQCGISDLGEHLETTNAAVSQLVDKLVQADMLTRTEDPTDRRAKRVALRPIGKDFVEQSIEERYRWVDQLAESLSDEESKKVAEALGILDEKMQGVEKRIR